MAECLRLLASVAVGRIVYTQRAMPAVELVNFALDGGDIVIRTDPGGALAAATHHTVVAFEADEVNAATGQGWSVMAVGRSREVTEPQDIARLRDIGLRSLVARRARAFHPGHAGHPERPAAGRISDDRRWSHNRKQARARPSVSFPRSRATGPLPSFPGFPGAVSLLAEVPRGGPRGASRLECVAARRGRLVTSAWLSAPGPGGRTKALHRAAKARTSGPDHPAASTGALRNNATPEEEIP